MQDDKQLASRWRRPPPPNPVGTLANPFCRRYCITICLAGRALTGLAPVQAVIPPSARDAAVRRLLLGGASPALPESRGCTCPLFICLYVSAAVVVVVVVVAHWEATTSHHITSAKGSRDVFGIHAAFVGFGGGGGGFPACGGDGAAHANVVNNSPPLRSKSTPPRRLLLIFCWQTGCFQRPAAASPRRDDAGGEIQSVVHVVVVVVFSPRCPRSPRHFTVLCVV